MKSRLAPLQRSDTPVQRERHWPLRLIFVFVRDHRAAVAFTVAALVALGDITALLHAIAGNPYWSTSTDFGNSVHAASAIAQGRNPYDYAVVGSHGGFDKYPFPPAFAEALIPLVLINWTLTRYVWILVSFGCLAGSCVLLLRGFGNRVPWIWVALVLALVCSTYLIRDDLYHGGVNFLLLFLLILGLRLLLIGRSGRAGIAWGLIFVVKPFLGVLLLYLIWRREWRAALASVVTSGSVFVLSFLLTIPGTGLSTITGWLHTMSYYASPIKSAQLDNYSLYALLLRLFVSNPYTVPWTANGMLLQVFSAVLIGLLVTTFLLTVPGRKANWVSMSGGSARLLVEVGLVYALTMSYGPLTETNHLVLLLPGFVGVIMMARGTSESGIRRRWWLVTVWALLFALVAAPVGAVLAAMTAIAGSHPQGTAILWTGRLGFLLLVIGALTALTLRQARQRAIPCLVVAGTDNWAATTG